MALFGLLGYSDNEILAGLSKQNNEIVRYIYKKYFPMVANYIRKNNGSDDDAKDIFQEGIIVLFQKTQSADFQLVDTSIKTYLYRVCQNIWLKRLEGAGRRKQRESIYEYWTATDAQIADNEIDTDTIIAQIPQLLDQLGEPCKGILIAYYFGKKSMTEIAQIHGHKDADSAKNQKYKCLNRLKKKVATMPIQQQNLS